MNSSPAIHPTALVHPEAILGEDVTVGPFAILDRAVRIGARTRIGPRVTLFPHTEVGADCVIHDHAVLGDLPQDLAFKGGTSAVRLGDGCVVREGVTVHRGTKPDTETVVGDGCFLMANSHVAHNCRLGRQVILANGVLLAGYVEVGDRAFISGNSVVHQFCRIGTLVMMSGLTAASKDVPPFCIIRSGHLNAVAGLNTVGLRRAGLSSDDRQALRRAFHVLYQAGLNISQAVARLRAERNTCEPVRQLCDFIETSRRGICRFEEQDDGDA